MGNDLLDEIARIAFAERMALAERERAETYSVNDAWTEHAKRYHGACSSHLYELMLGARKQRINAVDVAGAMLRGVKVADDLLNAAIVGKAC